MDVYSRTTSRGFHFAPTSQGPTMSTVTRKARNDIEFIEQEAIRLSNKPADWQKREAMIWLFVGAFSSFMEAAAKGQDDLEELLEIAQQGLLIAHRIEADCEPQLRARRDIQGLDSFHLIVRKLAAHRDNLLKQFEAAEEIAWAEIDKDAPSNEELLESAKKYRAPQQWYDEPADTSPLEGPEVEQAAAPEGRNHPSASE